MKALENMGLGLNWNAAAGSRHSQLHLFAGTPRDDANGSSAAVIFPGVIEKILHDQRCIFYLADNLEDARNVGFNPEVRRLRQRLEIVDPFVDQISKVDRLKP